jgi:hypothetical protein
MTRPAQAFWLTAALAVTPVHAATTSPDLSGVWRVSRPVTGLTTSDNKAPPLLAAAQKIYDERKAKLKAGDRTFDPSQRCKPLGQPRIMYESPDFPFEIMQTPRKLFVGYQWNRQPRFIYVNEQLTFHSPVYYGFSEARWDGDTLVVEVRGIDDATFLDASGMPHSDSLKVTERYRLRNAGKQLEVRYAFDDERTFSKPWETVVTFDKVPDGRIVEDICVDRTGLFRK